jgi:hypothetical protein
MIAVDTNILVYAHYNRSMLKEARQPIPAVVAQHAEESAILRMPSRSRWE